VVAPRSGAPPAAPAEELQGDLSILRDSLAKTRLASGVAPLIERIADARKLLEGSDMAQKAIYVFSDMQRISFERLAPMPESKPADIPELKQADIPIMLVDCSRKQGGNVGISDLAIAGTRVVDQTMELTATLVNSSPTDKVVNVGLHIDRGQAGQSIRKVLQRRGEPGARAVVRFYHRFTTGGVHRGQVAIAEKDDLQVDNRRRFSLDIADKVAALLVRPAAVAGGALDPAAVVQLALDPYAGTPDPWSVKLTATTAEKLDAAALSRAQVVLLADVPAFTPAQGQA